MSNVHFIKDLKENKLYEVTPMHIYVPTDGDIELVFKCGEANKMYRIGDVECYESRCAYENGASPLPLDVFEMYRIQQEEHFFTVANSGEYELKSVIMKDGVPTEIDAPIIGFVLSLHGNINHVLWDDDVDVKLLHKSVEDAIMYNNYKYTNEQGEEVERKGTRSHVLLNGKQQKALEKFKKALDELRDANVFIVLDEENYEAAAVNGESSYCEWDGEEGGLDPDRMPDEQKFTIRCINTYYGGNGDMHIYEKEEQQ